MRRKFTSEYLQELKSRADIVSLVSQVTKVEKLGMNYLAVCPFHGESNPSMQLDLSHNTFYCHACAAGSRNHSVVNSADAISFVRHAMNKSFQDAVEYLADKVGMTLPAMTPDEIAQEQQYQNWIERCKSIQRRFKENLASNQEAIKYLLNRGINETLIYMWGIGYGDDQDDVFKNTRGRITFPVFDYDGNIVSFSGRAPMSGEVLNSLNEKRLSEGKSPIRKFLEPTSFPKNKYLYGIDKAKDEIRKWRTAVIAEGYADVISLHHKGITHAVSTMGLSLSEMHVKLIKRAGADKAIIIRDGDQAGQNAALKDTKILMQHGIQPFVLSLPIGLDPDDFCRKFPSMDGKLARYIDQHRMSYAEWSILHVFKKFEDNIIHHLTTANDFQLKRNRAIVEELKEIKDPSAQLVAINFASELLCTTSEQIKKMMNFQG